MNKEQENEQPRCARCGHRIFSAAAIERGRGEHCERRWRRERREYRLTADQEEKAMITLLDQAVQPLRGRRVLAVAASKGDRVYKSAPCACTCPAGLYRGYHGCYHQFLAAVMQ